MKTGDIRYSIDKGKIIVLTIGDPVPWDDDQCRYVTFNDKGIARIMDVDILEQTTCKTPIEAYEKAIYRTCY